MEEAHIQAEHCRITPPPHMVGLQITSYNTVHMAPPKRGMWCLSCISVPSFSGVVLAIRFAMTN